MKTLFAVLLLATYASAQLPDAPSSMKKFIAIEAFAAASTGLDAFSTGRDAKDGCVETTSPWIYGKHPDMARTTALMAAENALAAFTSWQLRKHGKKFWATPLLSSAGPHLYGAIGNFRKGCY